MKWEKKGWGKRNNSRSGEIEMYPLVHRYMPAREEKNPLAFLPPPPTSAPASKTKGKGGGEGRKTSEDHGKEKKR